jgi:CubicO group peptidase (beta-lactamase class C family)
MQLWEQGLFDLDEDVNHFLPFSLKNPHYPDTNITFRMILSHHSSLASIDWKNGPFIYLSFSLFGETKERYEELLTPTGKLYNPKIWNDSAPGESLHYSNIGYFILEYLVEQISHQSFEEYCTRNIFQPLEMNQTSFHVTDYDKKELAIPYIWALNTYIALPNYEVHNYGVGGVRTSVKDLSHFLIAHMNNGHYKNKSILQEETIELIRTIQYPDENNTFWYEYGLGWRIMRRNNSYSLSHPGVGPGVATYINYNPIDNIGIIFFVNQYPLFLPYDMMSWLNLLLLIYEKAYSFL